MLTQEQMKPFGEQTAMATCTCIRFPSLGKNFPGGITEYNSFMPKIV
jgi:hypothetical protein